MQLHELTKDHRSMKSAVRNSKIGIDIANNNIRVGEVSFVFSLLNNPLYAA